MKTTKENIHENHRSRMRDRFVKSPDSLSNHELLELALFYAVPRVNVNPLAHTLINKYGSLSAVIHTPAEDLKQIDGVGDSVAVYLNMLGKISDTAQEEKFNNLKFYNYAEVKNYVVKHYSYYQSEVFTVFLLDAKARIIGRESFTQNDPSGVTLPFENFIRTLSVKNVKSIVVAHNHPSGICLPSARDDSATAQIALICKLSGIDLYDHVIVGDGDAYSYSYSGRLNEIKNDFEGFKR